MRSSQVILFSIATFKDVFPDETMLLPQDYLDGVSKEFVLKTASHLAGHKNWIFRPNRPLLFGVN
jgi:hypothetical protein